MLDWFKRRRPRDEITRGRRRLKDCPTCKWEPHASECTCDDNVEYVQYVDGSTYTELKFQAVNARTRAQLIRVGTGNGAVRVTINPDGSVTLPPLPPGGEWWLTYLPHEE